MSVSQNRVFEWVSQDSQPFVLGFLALVAVERFLYILRPKLQGLKQAPFEDRFKNPIKRLGNTVDPHPTPLHQARKELRRSLISDSGFIM